MKQSFTYSGDSKTRRDAIKKAKKEGMNFSTLVEKLLTSYVATGYIFYDSLKEKADKWDTLDDEIGDLYIGKEDSGLKDVGRFVIEKFGY